MGKIRNSSLDNVYGDGKQQIYTSDSGKQYRIKNSSLDNVHGDGKQKIVEEVGSSESFLVNLIFSLIPEKVQTLLGLIVVGFVLYIIIRIFIIFVGILF